MTARGIISGTRVKEIPQAPHAIKLWPDIQTVKDIKRRTDVSLCYPGGNQPHAHDIDEGDLLFIDLEASRENGKLVFVSFSGKCYRGYITREDFQLRFRFIGVSQLRFSFQTSLPNADRFNTGISLVAAGGAAIKPNIFPGEKIVPGDIIEWVLPELNSTPTESMYTPYLNNFPGKIVPKIRAWRHTSIEEYYILCYRAATTPHTTNGGVSGVRLDNLWQEDTMKEYTNRQLAALGLKQYIFTVAVRINEILLKRQIISINSNNNNVFTTDNNINGNGDNGTNKYSKEARDAVLVMVLIMFELVVNKGETWNDFLNGLGVNTQTLRTILNHIVPILQQLIVRKPILLEKNLAFNRFYSGALFIAEQIYSPIFRNDMTARIIDGSFLSNPDISVIEKLISSFERYVEAPMGLTTQYDALSGRGNQEPKKEFITKYGKGIKKRTQGKQGIISASGLNIPYETLSDTPSFSDDVLGLAKMFGLIPGGNMDDISQLQNDALHAIFGSQSNHSSDIQMTYAPLRGMIESPTVSQYRRITQNVLSAWSRFHRLTNEMGTANIIGMATNSVSSSDIGGNLPMLQVIIKPNIAC